MYSIQFNVIFISINLQQDVQGASNYSDLLSLLLPVFTTHSLTVHECDKRLFFFHEAPLIMTINM